MDRLGVSPCARAVHGASVQPGVLAYYLDELLDYDLPGYDRLSRMSLSVPGCYSHHGVQPQFGHAVFVAPGAVVIGDVVLGDDASVWFGTVVRGDVNFIRLGARTNLQDGSVVHVTRDKHPTILGADVTVGHQVVLHGCTVGDRCLVGMGSRLLDGVTLEDECLVAAGSLVPPGFHAPSGSLVVGSPAKIRRTLTREERDGLRQMAANYVAYKNEYLGLGI